MKIAKFADGGGNFPSSVTLFIHASNPIRNVGPPSDPADGTNEIITMPEPPAEPLLDLPPPPPLPVLAVPGVEAVSS